MKTLNDSNTKFKEKISRLNFFTIRNIVSIAIILGLLITIKYIQSFIPDLPNGLGDITVLMEIFLVLASIAIGWKEALVAVLIYIGIIAWTSEPIFLGGINWVDDIDAKVGVYFLDYFLPLVALSLAGLNFWSKNKEVNFKSIFFPLWVAFTVFLNYVFHVLSGVIFWGSYAWEGWGPWTYSIAANAIRNGVMLALSITVGYLGLTIKPHLAFQKGY